MCPRELRTKDEAKDVLKDSNSESHTLNLGCKFELELEKS